METSAINYRVADFLKRHPPFHQMDDADLLELAARGRVKFHEPNEYLLWQGEPHRHQIFVIQQGTVSLWDESNGPPELRDIRGAGDMLGIERYNGAEACLHSARSTSDVLVYAFPAADFDLLLAKYPYAREYVAADGSVMAGRSWNDRRQDPHASFVHDLVATRRAQTSDAGATVADVARALLNTGSDAIAVVDNTGRASGLVTPESLLQWIADGAGDAGAPVTTLLTAPPASLRADATVADGLITMGSANAQALALTSDGTPEGTLHAVVSARDLGVAFADHPVLIVREIGRAATIDALRALNQRARAFALQQLTNPAAVDWISRLLHLVDVAIVKQVLALADAGAGEACWCVCGAAGRTESLTPVAPRLVVLVDAADVPHSLLDAYARVNDSLAQCGYLPPGTATFDRAFHVATWQQWNRRYQDWIGDPVMTHAYRARPLFDLRPVHGPEGLWRTLDRTVIDAVNRDFIRVLANDCLASLPPLTFFQDAVVDESGAESPVFRLEATALRPLVDVGRVFGFAGRRVFGSSTLERLEVAVGLMPEHQAVFRDASETLRIVLWMQGRIGISQGTAGAELPPSLVSRHDRQRLKSGFRSIHRLLEITAASTWLELV